MSNKVENIGNQYTSERNRKKKRQQKKMRVVRRRITVFGGLLLAIIVILSIMLVVQNTVTIKQPLNVNIKKNNSKRNKMKN